ncbi:MAG: CDP-alcohol phosphatidyltransferase family protein [Minicystis sp.]
MNEPLLSEQTPKPEAVETPLDRLAFRPAAQLVVTACLPTPVSANALTLLGALVGAAGASLYRFTSRTNLIVGSALLLLWAILDCADGQLARARGTASRFGRILDGAGDAFVGLTLLIALILHQLAHGGPLWLAVAGIGSLALQTIVLDLVARRYLALAGAVADEAGDLAATRAAIIDLQQRQASAPTVLLHRVYAIFLRIQAAPRRLLPDYPDDPRLPALYAQRLGPVMRVFAYLGLTTHVAILSLCAAGDALPAYLWLRLTLGNALLIGLFLAALRRERVLAAELRAPPALSGLV